MNHVIVTGRLVRDSEMKYTNNGTALCTFSLANNTGYGDYEKTHFFNCELWGKKAEGLQPYLMKGKPLIIGGEMHQDRWEKDGSKFQRIKIRVNDVDFHMKDSTQGGGSTSDPNYVPRSNGEEKFADEEDFNDSIPF